ncbi:hypothetical protein OROHE_014756 [Orobanche hederae]
MCGCGVRSLRYLAEADADLVVANDANSEYADVISGNLERAGREKKTWAVKHMEANRLLTECFLERDYFDLIDVDSFGSESSYLRAAMCAVKFDGLLYVTSTDGYSSGGHQPQQMLIGGAVREASVLGYHVVPLFSYYSYHGPVFRVMLQVRRGRSHIERHYSFISYCVQCGNSRAFSWDELGRMKCSCKDVPSSLVVSGPLWTGPLHSSSFLSEMLDLAEQWGWAGNGGGEHIEKLLKTTIGESDPVLPSGYIKVDEIASRAKVNPPPINTLMCALDKEGYVASRSHIAPNAIKTNCPMVDCVKLVKELQWC